MAGAQGEERSAALTFVNTDRVGPSGPDDDLSDNAKAVTWLRQHDYKPGTFGASDLERLVELRAAIRELFAARADKKVAGRQAIERTENLTRQGLVRSMRHEWTELALLQLQTGNTASGSTTIRAVHPG